MVIEKGEHFVVTRGIKLNTSMDPMFASIFGVDTSLRRQDDEPKYDRSYEGDIFWAVAVADKMVAAKRIHATSPSEWHKLGVTISLNTGEIEVMSVTKDYVQAIMGENYGV